MKVHLFFFLYTGKYDMGYVGFSNLIYDYLSVTDGRTLGL